ncbi:dipeptide/oligopeptide/nickel ABC transporter permease/ATP-binding protein [Pseudarthrobacter cellobiosi]|uniref:dipeptide/oligopeptide/nickel ABC transporter permease/ATP-binding protein n=1 Tax=Pseudarthrobacter cellobiosi TaxID=2953654 RepID=UPI00208E245F|nr:dipeptide/oligopeptide/nickel ABC transporter permease/ATP-binding protein [Pseudarthrobacter sp. HLT1-5]MCO4256422.1 dipeptide/oligopeptide/nickel ABC transporter permease/ATP-binding protein [Pseudarthrobacter sp. HLT1-5]
MSRFRSKEFWTPAMITGAGLLTALVLIAIIAPLTMRQAAEQLTPNAALGPSAEHWLGTDDFGRDLLARALVATRLTLLMTTGAAAISVISGVVIGLAIWLSGRRVREIALRVLETAVAYPSLIFALVIAAVLEPGVSSAVIAIGIAGIPGFARITANLASSVSNSDYVVTARLLGVSPVRIAARHMLPNMAEPLLILSATVFALSLVEISALSFIGLGVQSPEYDFGRLLNDSLGALYTQPVEAVGPSVMIALTGLSVMLIGDALAAHADPRAKRTFFRRVLARNRTVTVPDTDTALVRVENLRISIPGQNQLVKGLSFSINPGEVVALVGESGSGKSLTAMAIAGLPSEDLVVEADLLRVDNMNMLAAPNPSRLAKEISIIYQDPGTTFNPSLRMGSQLTEVLRTHLGMGGAKARKVITEALASVNITEPANRLRQHPHELSGGMRQRAMIAASIVTSPKLIVADEPTTALDVTVQAEVLRQFRRIHREQGTAMLFISHDLAVVQAVCDTILVMKSGEIVERLTSAQLAARDVHHPYTKALLAAIPTLDLGPVAYTAGVGTP